MSYKMEYPSTTDVTSLRPKPHVGCFVSPVMKEYSKRVAEPYMGTIYMPNQKAKNESSVDSGHIFVNQRNLLTETEAPNVKIPVDSSEVLMEDLLSVSSAAKHKKEHVNKKLKTKKAVAGNGRRSTTDGRRSTTDGRRSTTDEITRRSTGTQSTLHDWDTFSVSTVKYANLFPEHSLHIRWPLSTVRPVYTLEGLEDLLSVFGRINYVGQTGNNSVIVVTNTPEVAVNIAQFLSQVSCDNKLQCDWLFPHMNSLDSQKMAVRRTPYERRHVEQSPSQQELHKFMVVQKFCRNLLGVFYEKSTFNGDNFIP